MVSGYTQPLILSGLMLFQSPMFDSCILNYNVNKAHHDGKSSNQILSQHTRLYYHLEDNIDWEDGVRSKSGFTRKAKPMQLGIDSVVDNFILESLSKIGVTTFGIYGIYRDGEDWTPNHSHPGMKQVVISLGSTRKLTMNNGDIIIFGSAVHGVPKDPNCTTGRISIALFLEK